MVTPLPHPHNTHTTHTSQYGTDFYILDKYPLAVRPFYTMPDPTNPVSCSVIEGCDGGSGEYGGPVVS